MNQDWTTKLGQDLKVEFETFEDWPKPGITFIDIGSLFQDPIAWQSIIVRMARLAEQFDPDFLLGMDARGFPLVGALAIQLQLGFAMCRKAGKLPGKTIDTKYSVEYRPSDVLELQPARIKGERVLIVDDVAATGGTIDAAATLLRALGKDPIGAMVIFDLPGARARKPLSVPVFYLYEY